MVSKFGPAKQKVDVIKEKESSNEKGKVKWKGMRNHPLFKDDSTFFLIVESEHNSHFQPFQNILKNPSYPAEETSPPSCLQFALAPALQRRTYRRTNMPYSSKSRDDVDEEYDPTAYRGGYDLVLTFGRPLPPSKETCYPISSSEQQNNNQRPQYRSSQSNMNQKGTRRPSDRSERTTEARNKDSKETYHPSSSSSEQQNNNRRPQYPPSQSNSNQKETRGRPSDRSERTIETQNKDFERLKSKPKSITARIFSIRRPKLADTSGYGSEPKINADQGGNQVPLRRQEQQQQGKYGRGRSKSADSSGYGFRSNSYVNQGANLPLPLREEQRSHGDDYKRNQEDDFSSYDGRSGRPTFEKPSYKPIDSSGYGFQPNPYVNQEEGFSSYDGRSRRPTFEKPSYEPINSSGYGFQPKTSANQGVNLPPSRREEQYGYGDEYKRNQEDGLGSYDGRSGQPTFEKSSYQPADSSGYGYQPKPYEDQGMKLPSLPREEQQGGYSYGSEYKRNQDDRFDSYDGRSGRPSYEPQRYERRFP